jgi:hypothetical protein
VKTLSIFQKLLISHLFIGVCTLLLVASLFYHSFKEALIERTVAQLSSINDLKQIYIEDYFEGMQQSTQLLAKNALMFELAGAYSRATDTSEINAYFALLQQEFAYQDLLLFDSTLSLLYHQTNSFILPADSAFQPADFRRLLRRLWAAKN